MTLQEEKKTAEHGDDKIAAAEALAAEALKAAEEAKLAAERLAEVRASIQLLSSNRKAAEASTATTTSTTISKPLKEKVVEKVEAPKVELAAPAEKSPELASPPTSPVSILKSETSEKAGSKEVRYAPDVQTEKQPESRTVLSTEEEDMLTKFLDAVGLDKMCGLDGQDFEDAARAEAGSLPQTKAAALVAMAAEADNTVEEEPVATAEETVEPTVEPVEQRNEETEAAATEAVSTPVVDDEPAGSDTPASPTEVPSPVKQEPPEQVPLPPADEVREEAPAPEGETATDALSLEVEKETTTPVKLSPAKRRIMAKYQQHHMLSKPDPFGGEHESLEFMACGDGDVACGATAFPEDDDEAVKEEIVAEKQDENQIVDPNSSVFCGCA